MNYKNIATPLTLLAATTLFLMGCQSASQSASKTAATTVQVSQDTGKFQLPAYETVKLDNGLTLMLMPQKEVPLITVNAVVRAGSVDDNIGGIASMTADSLLLGAGKHSKQQLEQQIDFLGASLNTSSGREGSYLSADFMAKDTDIMLGLVADVLLQPRFDKQEFAKLKQRNIAELEQSKESPKSVINRYFSKLIFADHPYGNATSGDRDSLAKLTLPEVKAFYHQFYQPGNTAISVVGDFDPVQMKAKLQQLFGRWSSQKPAPMLDLSQGLPSLTQSQVLLVDKPDAIETTFLIGGMGVARNNPDYIGLSVVNTILGGRFTSWLNDELRVNSGLTYGARSSFISYRDAGLFEISTFTKMSSTEQAVDLALKTYQRLWDKGIDEATLASAKAYVKGQFPPRYETNGELAGLLSDMYIYGFDASYINDFQKRVDSLTVAESKRLIDTYFPKDKLQFVLIGNAAKIAPIAAKYGQVKQLDIKAVGFGG
ncbi:M16 family metallopeptidase [Shewanella fodinae]|uniref:M16 family metallopeptidase n=1 Tax=Shewanella fodinae TaxID=552357 RepID=UPI0016719A8C|nr:pitrilysin family protein [Shewanella fodinae]MCL2906103.1 insulinase family protein [Shewanella fodinae]GGY98461.1 peptidase M16 [Shewanella fodinae]